MNIQILYITKLCENERRTAALLTERCINATLSLAEKKGGKVSLEKTMSEIKSVVANINNKLSEIESVKVNINSNITKRIIITLLIKHNMPVNH